MKSILAELKASTRTELKFPTPQTVESTNTTTFVSFFGNRLAKVGFILDYAAVSLEEASFLECLLSTNLTHQSYSGSNAKD